MSSPCMSRCRCSAKQCRRPRPLSVRAVRTTPADEDPAAPCLVVALDASESDLASALAIEPGATVVQPFVDDLATVHAQCRDARWARVLVVASDHGALR